MARKKAANGTEHPDYEKLLTPEEVDVELKKYRDSLVTKDFLERRMKSDRKEYAQAINAQLKEVAEEREHAMGVIGALQDRKKQLVLAPGSSTNVIPMKKMEN